MAFIAAALAFGRVQSVLNSIEGMLPVMGPSPAAFVRDFAPARDRDRFKHLVHRWTNGADFAALAWILHQMIERSGSIENFFVEGLADDAVDVGEALQSFSTRALALDVSAVYGRKRPKPGVAYFFSRPSSGGACKRLNLFLRWMVREDRVDLGVWKKVRPGQLIVPLDTHIIRVGQCLRLTRLKSPGLAHGGRHHRVTARDRSGRSDQVRLLDLPPRHDERVRIREENRRFPLSAQRRLLPRQRRERGPRTESVEDRDESLYFAGRSAPRPSADRQAAHPFLTIILALATGICLATMGFTFRDELLNSHAALSAGDRFARLDVSRPRRRAPRPRPRAVPRFRDRATSFEHSAPLAGGRSR